MIKSDWQRAKQIFLDALDLDENAREPFVAAKCGDNQTVYEEVIALLAANEEHKDFIETPAFSLNAAFNGTSSLVGKNFGHYRILSEIGHGGMGAVFLAERADGQFNQKVAIKIVRPGLDTEHIRVRFVNERQILADLEHPYISHLIDGGTTDDGIPYLVMEHIEGTPITEYCSSNKLSTRGKLDLFLKVCEAVAFAHRKLVIHRDLKPSNIFVTIDGQPKLLDFGIAKLLDQRGEGRAQQTQLAAFTPDYASPEQVRGQSISTATDVYSLGMILYQLLTDSLPYRFSTRSPEEIIRVICETDPSPPNRVISENVAANALNRVETDLENIVLLAIRKEPERRYRSVEQFAEDIRRYLSGLPVSAREDTFGYRASKFARRHKYGVAAAVLISMTLVLGIVGTTWQARVAQRESEKARRINSFLQNMLGSAAPESRGADITVKAALEESSKRVREEFAGDPDVLADILMTIGKTYVSLDMIPQAEMELKGSIAARTASGEVDHPTTATSLAYLGIALGYQQKSEEGEEVSRRGLELCRKLYPDGHEDTAVALFALSINLTQKGDAAAAEPYAQEASIMIKRFLGEKHGYYLATLTALGLAREGLGNIESSESLFQQVITAGRNIDSRFQIYVAQASLYLGRSLLRRQAYYEAEKPLLESRRIYSEVLGASNSSVATVTQYLGNLYLQKGQFQKAERELSGCLAMMLSWPDPDPSDVNQTNYLLGRTLTKLGKLDEAEKILRKTLGERVNEYPPGDIMIANGEGALGECLAAKKQFAEARPLLTRSHETILAEYGPADHRTIEAAERLAMLDSKSSERK